MTRSIIAAITICFFSLAIAPAFADEPDFKSSEGIKKFWAQQDLNRGGGGESGN